MTLDLVNTLSELVALPSVNPMGRAVSGPEYFEYRVTDYLRSAFPAARPALSAADGRAEARQYRGPARRRRCRRLEGGQLVLFEAHQDTVPVDGMTIEPWTPVVRDGRLYGRGACDIKGGMTAMLGAVARLAEERPSGMPTIIMACTVNEEHGFQRRDRADAAVVASPVRSFRGRPTWRWSPSRPNCKSSWHTRAWSAGGCHTHGRATHSSQPHLGVNAIFKMARVAGGARALSTRSGADAWAITRCADSRR